VKTKDEIYENLNPDERRRLERFFEILLEADLKVLNREIKKENKKRCEDEDDLSDKS
jgi:hypothetical protein